MSGNVVDKVTALADFDRFTDLMDLDVDVSEMDQDDIKNFEEMKGHIIKSMMRGNLIIDEKGQPVFTPTGMGDENALTFHEPTGATLMSMDRRKSGQDVGKMLVVMTEMTRSSDGTFSTMKNRDFKVCSAIVAVFLG